MRKGEDEKKTNVGCREPDIVLRRAKRVERSSDFDRLGRIVAHETYMAESVPTVLIEASISTT